jgi:hypothetical protein
MAVVFPDPQDRIFCARCKLEPRATRLFPDSPSNGCACGPMLIPDFVTQTEFDKRVADYESSLAKEPLFCSRCRAAPREPARLGDPRDCGCSKPGPEDFITQAEWERRVAQAEKHFPLVCTYCKNQLSPGNIVRVTTKNQIPVLGHQECR